MSEPKGRAAVWTEERGREERAPERGGKTAGQAPRRRANTRGSSFGEEGGRLTYGSYLRLPELLAQQVPQVVPPAHDELLFITVHQAYELWFKQLLHELTAARDAMRPGQDWRARQLLQRAHVIERLLVSQVDVLETMTPQDFLQFRAALAPASGFQSVQFRELEFLSGAKDPRFVTRFRALDRGRTGPSRPPARRADSLGRLPRAAPVPGPAGRHRRAGPGIAGHRGQGPGQS